MKPGTVLFHKGFTFEDGGQADKLLVILSPPFYGHVLVVKTTSQQRQRPLKDGCHVSDFENLFTFNANLAGFKKTTWIVLDPLVLNEGELKARTDKGICSQVLTLRDTDLRAIINCLRRCEDVSPQHLKFLT